MADKNLEARLVDGAEYEKPAIVDLGELRELTAAGGPGNRLDGTYIQHTPGDPPPFS